MIEITPRAPIAEERELTFTRMMEIALAIA